jgi:hypothetical protein
MPLSISLPALRALEHYPHLRDQVAPAIASQVRRIAERVSFFVPRPDAVTALDAVLAAQAGGLIALDGPAGGGATTLLCHLASERECVFWFPAESGVAGLEALCAQLIALCDLPVALVPPAAGRDATTLERLLGEAGATRAPDRPLLVILDTFAEHPELRSLLPSALPPGVVVVAAEPPSLAYLPAPAARLMLPAAGAALTEQLLRFCTMCGCTPAQAQRVVRHSGGSFLYARIVATLLATGQLPGRRLPEGLGALHALWWSWLEPHDRRIMEYLGAAGEPIGPGHLGALAQLGPPEAHRRAARWFPIVEFSEGGLALSHAEIRRFVASASGDALMGAHASHAQLLRASTAESELSAYATRQYARHVALSEPLTRAALAPHLSERSWVMGQERRTGGHAAAAGAMAWAMRAVEDAAPLLLVRTAALCGTLTLLARRLAPDAAAGSLTSALERGAPREQAVRSIRAMIEQLPDGRNRAAALRGLGEVCYTLRMRATAMRMLSEALDLETYTLPRSWRDDREEALVALARAAVAHGWPDTALGITTLITHAERRGLVDTEVVRWLLAEGQRTRAEEVAYAIGHAGSHEWAMAEVAVGHARAGDFERASVVFDTLRTDTAIAWAATELGCDSARNGNPRAVDRVAMLRPAALRDRALAQVAEALAANHLTIEAFAAVTLIESPDVRLRALVAMAEADPVCAPTALAGGSRALADIAGDERASAIAVLASAYAAAGFLDQALATAALLEPGEERDRAGSRIATALARRGDHLAAATVALNIADDDERSWAYDALARLLAAGALWREAFALAAQIGDDEQRAQTEADLAIAWARAGNAAEAHARAAQIPLRAARIRALVTIVSSLAEAGMRAPAFIASALQADPDARSRYLAAAAAALAVRQSLDQAEQVVAAASRPLDRSRAWVAIAGAAAAQGDTRLAQRALADALHEVVRLGRAETLACLGLAGEVLALLGGAELLLSAASTLDELDTWWVA